MTDFSDSPIKQILFDKLVDMGRLSSNPSNSTIQTIRDISDSDALKLLKSLPGGGPELKNMGGMMNINNMTRPVSYMAAGGPMDAGDFGDAPGVDPKVDPLKDTRRLASARTSTAKPYETFLKDAGYTKPASVDDIKKYAAKGIKIKLGEPIGSNTAFRNTLSALNVKQGTQEATNVLNQALQRAKKPLYVTGAAAGKDVVEDLIGVVTNTEFGKSGTKEIRDSVSKEIKDLKTTGNKIHGANPSKTKDAFFKTTLEKMYPVLKTAGKAATILSTVIAKKALGAFPIATEMGSDDMPLGSDDGESARIKQRLMKENNITQEQMNQIANQPMDLLAPINKRGGGMMDINNMVRPIGYQEGGPVPRSRQQSVMEEEIMQQAMQNKAEPQGGILSGLMSLINKGKDAFNPYVMDAMDIVLLGREEGMNIEQAQGIVDQSQDEERTIDRNSDQFKKLQVLKEQALKQMRRDAGIR